MGGVVCHLHSKVGAAYPEILKLRNSAVCISFPVNLVLELLREEVSSGKLSGHQAWWKPSLRTRGPSQFRASKG